MANGTLYLIPNVLAKGTATAVLGPQIIALLPLIRHFAVEEIKSARQLLRGLDRQFPIDESTFWSLTKTTTDNELKPMMQALLAGHHVGIIAEAGCPGVADPGAQLVAKAHQAGVKVVPLVGPSSFIMALMASGLNGQSFAFSGYLPIDERGRIQFLKQLEAESAKYGRTQLFMDTPYRNIQVWQSILKTLHPETLICVAAGLTGPEEFISTQSVKKWQAQSLPPINKVPTVFLMLA